MVNDLTATKLVAMSILGLVSILCGMIPVVISKKLGWTSHQSASSSSVGTAGNGLSPFARSLLSGILCFGGGILMGTGFLHLLPEVYEGWQTYAENNHIDVNLSLGIVVVCAGFFLVYGVEEVVHLIVDRQAHNKADVSLHRVVSIRGCPVSLDQHHPPETVRDAESGCAAVGTSSTPCESASICELDCNEKEFCGEAKETPDGCCSVQTAGSKFCPVIENPVIPTIVAPLSPPKNERYGTFGSSPNNRKSHHIHDSFSSAGHSHRHSHHHHGVGASKMHGLFIIVALSLHEILEGMAVGLQNDKSGVIQLSTAVASHKFVISFCVGMELSTSGVKLILHTIYILTFSLVTPIGMGIGIAMTSHLDEGDPDQALGSLIMQGLACGTILYVAFFEILERERAKSMVGLIQWFLLVLGFLAIMGLQSQAKEPSFKPSGDMNNASTVSAINLTAHF